MNWKNEIDRKTNRSKQMQKIYKLRQCTLQSDVSASFFFDCQLQGVPDL